MIVTIDGPAGSGKSSAAKLLAERLRQGIDLGNLVEVEAELPALQIKTPPGKVLLNGEGVSLDIRSPAAWPTPTGRYNILIPCDFFNRQQRY